MEDDGNHYKKLVCRINLTIVKFAVMKCQTANIVSTPYHQEGCEISKEVERCGLEKFQKLYVGYQIGVV